MSSLAPIEAISFFSGVQKKRYSGKRERYWQKNANCSLLILKIIQQAKNICCQEKV